MVMWVYLYRFLQQKQKRSNSMNEILTVQKVASYLRLSRTTVWRWCNDGKLPAFKVGRGWRIPRSEVQKMLAGSLSGQQVIGFSFSKGVNKLRKIYTLVNLTHRQKTSNLRNRWKFVKSIVKKCLAHSRLGNWETRQNV